MKRNLYIIIPVLNEAQNVPRLVESIFLLKNSLEKEFEIHCVVVDDGSTDQTSILFKREAEKIRLILLTHQTRLGPGAAFSTAFQHVVPLLLDEDWVLTCEGDNTSRLALVNQMLVRSREGFDVVFASPYLYGGAIVNTSLWRVFLSAASNLLVKEFIGLRGLMTVSSFFRLYRAPVLKKLAHRFGPGILERSGFECMLEMSVKLVLIGASITEIAMTLDTRLRAGKSKMNVLKTIYGYGAVYLAKSKWAQQGLAGK